MSISVCIYMSIYICICVHILALTSIRAAMCSVKRTRARPDLSQGPADLQSAALTNELCTQLHDSC